MSKKAKKHKQAKQINELIKNKYTVINSTVLIEMLNNLHKKRYEPREDIINTLYNINEIHYLAPKDYEESLKLCKDYNFSVNYSDCTILKTMMNYNINTVVSFDSDFDKIGINRFYL